MWYALLMISDMDRAKLKGAVKSAIRQAFSRSDSYKGFLELHRIEWYAGKRLRVSYPCACCGHKFPKKDIQVDHIVPIGYGAYTGLEDALSYSELIYCSYDNLQILCRPCHTIKTNKEKANKSFHNAVF